MENNVLEIHTRSAINQKIDRAFEKIPDKLKKFFYSDLYLFIMTAVSVIAWATGQPVISFVFISLMAAVLLIILDDATPAIPLIFFAMLGISSDDIAGQLKYIPVFVPTVLALVFHILHYRPCKKLGKMFWPQIAITVVMLLGGCATITAERYTGALGYTILLGLGVLVFYEVFYQYCKPNAYVKMTDFFAKMLVFLGIVMFCEVAIYYIRTDIPVIAWGSNRADLGWGVATNVSMMLLLTIPMCFYFAAKSKNPTGYVLLGIAQFVANFLTFSRGGILFGAIMLVITVVYTLVKAENRRQMFLCYLFVFVVILIMYFSVFRMANDAIRSLLNRGFGTSGRFDLYREAWGCFCEHPIFGVGMGFDGDYYEKEVINFYWFHSTFFQIIGSTGLVGVLGFAFFYVVRYQIVFRKIKVDKFYMYAFFAFLGFELYSMIDTGTFIPVPFMTILILINMAMEKDSADYHPLPRKLEIARA